MSLYERTKAEIEDLHRSMFEWCAGAVTESTSAWDRIKQSWAPGFRLADSEGLVEGSKHLLSLQVRFNESVDDPLRAVWIEGFTGYDVAEDLFQAFYEEWRFTASGQERGRAWSVLVRSAGEGPHELEWVHAHRGWLADEARPSFRPLEAEADSDEDPEEDEPESGQEPGDLPWAGPPAATLEDAPDDVPWGRRDPSEVERIDPPEVGPEVPPLAEVRAFFGDAAAQALVGGAAPPEFDQHDPERWLRELRKGGPQAVLRASLVVLGHLLKPWNEWFPEESAPQAIHDALSRYRDGDESGLAEAKALAEAAQESSDAAQSFEPDEDEIPDGFRAYVHATNAGEAAARLAGGAGGSAIALAVKLSPVLAALTQPVRLALRAEVLAALPEE